MASPIDDLDGAVGAHDGDLGGGPCEIDIRSDVLGTHDAVGPTVGLAENHGDLRDRRFGKGEKKLGSIADDPTVLLGGSGHETRDILEGDQRDIERIAEADESCALDGGVVVEHPGESLWLIGDDAGGSSVEAGKAHDEVGCEIGLDLEEAAVVHHPCDHLAHIVGKVRVVGKQEVEFGIFPVRGIIGGRHGRSFEVILGQVGEE